MTSIYRIRLRRINPDFDPTTAQARQDWAAMAR